MDTHAHRPDSDTAIPPRVVAAMTSGRRVTYGPVVLRPPTQPGARGSSGQHRLEWTDPVTGERKQGGATKLADAWKRVVDAAKEIDRVTKGLDGEPAVDTALARLVAVYLDPAHHDGWGESRRNTVTSLLTNWIIGDDITIDIGTDTVAAGRLPVGRLTPALCEQILRPVRDRRAYRTYVDVHRELGTLLRWAARERYLPRNTTLPDDIPRARPTTPSRTASDDPTVRPVDPDDIPPVDAIDRLREVAVDDEGPAAGFLIDSLAYGGLRIGEGLGLVNDDRTLPFDPDEGCYRPYVWQQTEKDKNGTRPPKHHRTRHAWLPPWLTDDLDRIRQTVEDGQPLLAAPRGGFWPTNRFRQRRFDRWLEAAGWPRLPEDDDRQRAWKWTAHSLRHHAATWMLNELILAPDDVAEFLGHADGHQIWVMYSRVRPGLVGRASTAARRAGDPRGDTRRSSAA